MTMQIVVFRATLADDSMVEEHTRIAGDARDHAKGMDGCLEWRDSIDGLTYWGYVVFRSDEAVQAWKNDPRHAEIRRRGERAVYTEFATHVFAEVRHANWRRDPVGG